MNSSFGCVVLCWTQLLPWSFWLPWLFAEPVIILGEYLHFYDVWLEEYNMCSAREIPTSWLESSCRTWCLGQCVTLDSRSASKGFCNWTGVCLSFLAGNDFQLGCELKKGGQSLSQEGDGGGGEVQEEGLELSPSGEQGQLLPYGGDGSWTWRSVACVLLLFKLVCFPTYYFHFLQYTKCAPDFQP